MTKCLLFISVFFIITLILNKIQLEYYNNEFAQQSKTQHKVWSLNTSTMLTKDDFKKWEVV